MLHQAIKPIQLNNPFYIRKENGEVETRFLVAPPEKKDVTIFPTQIVMLQPMSYVCEDGLKINAFREDGKPCYEANHPLATYGGIFVTMLNVEKKTTSFRTPYVLCKKFVESNNISQFVVSCSLFYSMLSRNFLYFFSIIFP